ncbi:hypothetical protein N7454_010911 [Penicillium verhagenii]|nr:hypothetical protein N7454_010911 [Penicillium verhagenii]
MPERSNHCLSHVHFVVSTTLRRGGTITEHIVGHLRFLALKSFPPYHDEVSEASDVESASSPAAKTYKRSTIDNDPDRTTVLNFEDTGSISARGRLGIKNNVPEDELRKNFSKGEDGLSKTYNKRSLPSLEGSSPIEEWSNFVDIPLSGVDIPIWECRDFEWGFATVDPEADKNSDDPVLQDLSQKQHLPASVARKSRSEARINDIDDYLGYSTRDIQDDNFEKLVLAKETPKQPLSQSDSPRLLDPFQVDSHTPVAQRDISDTLKHLRSVPDYVHEEASRGSSSSPMPTTEVPKRNEASMSQLKSFFKQGSRELSGDSASSSNHPQPELSTQGPSRPLEPILVENTPIGPILNLLPENLAESLHPSNLGHLESKPVIDNSILDDMILRLLGTVRTSGGRFSRLLGLSSTSVPKRVCLKTAEINMICDASREMFLSQPVFLELNAPVKVVGDIHGQYTDLIRVFNLCGYPSTTNYLFLGDYVDRGKQSLETILLLLCYKLRYPQTFFLLRGNHECANVTRVYGFFDECKRRTTIKTWKTFIDVFNCMPIAAIIAKKIFCVHGGLSPALAHFDDIRNIARPTDVPDYGLLNDLLWSDPADMEEDWEPNERGVSYCFGKRVIMDFLQRHDLDLVCRAHMVVEDGYEFYQDRILVTLFSAPNYCGEFDNWGGIMTVSSDLLCSFDLLPPLDAKKRGSAEDVASSNRSEGN